MSSDYEILNTPPPIPAPRTKRGRQVAALNVVQHQQRATDDLNLTALIDSVERDIWLLEQLENKSRNRNPLSLDLPITGILNSKELLNLPGYKPRNKPVLSRAPQAPPLVDSMNGDDDDEEEEERDETTPPSTPTTSTSSSSSNSSTSVRRRHSSADRIGDYDVLHQRLLPKSNCVTNIMYSRRLPSPPVVRKGEEMHQSSSQKNRKLFCPFCAQTFGYHFGLECHLLSVHYDDLQDIRCLNSTDVKPRFCPCCRAQFLKPGLVVRHLVCDHPDYVVNTVINGTNVNRNGSDFITCRFCNQQFLKRHQKIFMIHLEQKHNYELERIIHQNELSSINKPAAPTVNENLTVLYSPLRKTIQGFEDHIYDSPKFNSPCPPPVPPYPRPRLPSINALEHPSRVTKQTLSADHQFIDFPIHYSYRKAISSTSSSPESTNSCDNKNTAKTSTPAKKGLRFSIPEAVHHHYDVIEDGQSIEKDDDDDVFIKRDRSSGEEENSGNKVRQVKKRLKRIENNADKRRSAELIDLLKSSSGESRGSTSSSTSDVKSILKPTNYYKHQRPKKGDNNFVNGTPCVIKAKKSYVRQRSNARKLVEPMENTYRRIPQPEPPECGGDTSDSSSNSNNNNNNNEVKVPKKLYKCNLCEVAFVENAFLLTHLKNKHRSGYSLALKPQYSCGGCPAKFFKNSFLVKHCLFHHMDKNTDEKTR